MKSALKHKQQVCVERETETTLSEPKARSQSLRSLGFTTLPQQSLPILRKSERNR